METTETSQNSPESPASGDRFTAIGAAIDLTNKFVVTVVIAQVKSRVLVQVLDLKLDFPSIAAGIESLTCGLWAHGFCLAWCIVTGEHAAVLSASIASPASCFFFP